MLNDPIDLALVKAINDISRSLDKRSVAEYVENKEIFLALKERYRLWSRLLYCPPSTG